MSIGAGRSSTIRNGWIRAVGADMSRRASWIVLVVVALMLVVRPSLALYIGLGAAPGLLLLGVWKLQEARVSADGIASARTPPVAANVPAAAASPARRLGCLFVLIMLVALTALGLSVGFIVGQFKAGVSGELGVTGPRSLPLSATYMARARIPSGHAGTIEERLEVPEGAIRHLERRHLLSARMLNHMLVEHGWYKAVLSAEPTFQFVRSQPEDWKFAEILPRQTKNELSAPFILLPGTHVGFRIFFDRASQIVIEAPTSAIGETYPTATRDGIHDGEEELTLPLPPLERPVEFELRSSAFRQWPLTYVQSITAWNPFGALLGALLTLTSKRIRTALARYWRRARGMTPRKKRSA
jgi:hypothetical protein